MGLFYLKENDTLPVLEVTLKNPDTTVRDLTGVTGVKLHVRLDAGTFTRDMVVDPTPTTGKARYTWAAADWSGTPALVVGRHRMEYEVIAGAARQTFPNFIDDEDILVISDDIGQG